MTTPNSEIAQAPDWLVGLCGEAKPPAPRETTPATDLDTEGAIKQAVRYLATEAPLPVMGGRSDTTYRVAAHVKDLGVSVDAAIELMTGRWEPRWQVACERDDFEASIQHAYRYGQEAPGAKSPAAEFTAVEGEVIAMPTGEVVPAFTLEEVSIGSILSRPAEPLEMLIEGFLPAACAVSIVAPGGSGKSMLVLQLGGALATGLAFADNPAWTVAKPRRVLIVNAEDDESEFRRRAGDMVELFTAQRAAMVAPAAFPDGDDMKHARAWVLEQLTERLYYRYVGGKDERLVKPNSEENTPHVDALITAIKSLPSLDLLVLDPVRQFTGGVGENEAAMMTALVRAARRIQNEAGCGVLLVHHVNKASEKDGSREAWASAGSGALTGHVRQQINLLRMTKEEAKKYGISEDDRRRFVGVNVGAKANYMDGGPLVFLERDPDSPLLRYRTLTPQRTRQATEDYEAVLDCARAQLPELVEPISRNKFAELFAKDIDLGKRKVRDVLKLAIERGDLVEIAPKQARRGVRLALALPSASID